MAAQWIGDGYDERGEIGEFSFEYRPLPKPSRVALARRLKPLSREKRDVIVRQTLHQCILHTCPIDSMQREIQMQAFALVTGATMSEREQSDEWNLRAGVRLLVLYPQFSLFSCETCRTLWLDPTTGQIATYDGKRLPREGKTLCENPTQTCPVGHYSRQRRLSERNQQAVRHYLECAAVGKFPDDPLVRHHARLIQWSIARAKADRCRKTTTSTT
ncbi:hypothetical protein [Planctomicrobium piriforme]|uniref:Uncharacterized protein n=1 Tax=Planctomicrobium piriforme TaxID=1576369 RepID=A0A1I3EC54_9PLAN|nr:hypothetical protein [Planctomicrobium piriforme]SFH96459.1 hypothetical protein SAMN05421753_104157 [Planctomicrobium piriforme]